MADDHPIEDELEFTEDALATEVVEMARDETVTGLLETSDPRLAQVSFTFIDSGGVQRTWSLDHDDYDPENYDD